MRLILSCVNENESVIGKDHLLLMVDTKTKKTKWLELNIHESNDIIGTKGLGYSGDYLLSSIITNNKRDRLLVINVVTERHNISNYTKSKDVRSIHSVFRGRFYVCSSGTNAMNSVVLSPATTNIIKDVKHFDFGIDIHFNSFVNWSNRWYASFYGNGWRDGNYENGAIIELSSNNRKIYSNINQPNSLFFNRNDELCFCESGRSLFHFGRKIVWTGRGYPRGVVEDRENNGYWIACTGNETLPRLKFFDSNGDYSDSIDLEYGYKIYSIVKAEGYLSKLRLTSVHETN